MSQDLRLEEGTNSNIRNFHRGSHSCNDFVAKSFLYVKKIIDPQRPYGYWLFLISCVMVISVDPLFFYVPTIAVEQQCLGFDRKLRVTAIVLHSIFGIVYLTYVNFLLPSKIEVKPAFLRFSLIDLLVVLPLPLVLLTLVIDIPTLGVEKSMVPMNLFLVHYLLRVIRIYTLFTRATRISGILAEAKWAKAAFNLLLYLHGGHVFGALWYFFAVEREMVCWKNVCSLHAGCSRRSFYCDNESSGFSVSGLCRDNPGFDFGIFDDALQYGIVETTSFVMKFSYCLRWGLQSLRFVLLRCNLSLGAGDMSRPALPLNWN